MANFIESEAVKEQISATASAAKKMNLSASNLAQSANASFAYEDGDKLTIPAQVAKIVPLTGSILATAKANKRAEGYFAFDAFVTRDKKEIPCSVSLRQLYTPTVWTEAETLEGVTDADGNDIEAFTAPFRDGKKRFGECGAVQTLDGVPYLAKDIKIDLALQDVFVPMYLDSEIRESVLQPKFTALVKREGYAVAL